MLLSREQCLSASCDVGYLITFNRPPDFGCLTYWGRLIGVDSQVYLCWHLAHVYCRLYYLLTFELATLLMFLNVNLRLIFLILSMLPNHVSSPRLRTTFYSYIWRVTSFILYCIVLYCEIADF